MTLARRADRGAPESVAEAPLATLRDALSGHEMAAQQGVTCPRRRREDRPVTRALSPATSSNGSDLIVTFGVPGDVAPPIPAAIRRLFL